MPIRKVRERRSYVEWPNRYVDADVVMGRDSAADEIKKASLRMPWRFVYAVFFLDRSAWRFAFRRIVFFLCFFFATRFFLYMCRSLMWVSLLRFAARVIEPALGADELAFPPFEPRPAVHAELPVVFLRSGRTGSAVRRRGGADARVDVRILPGHGE
jgi:hypothetical protein